MWLASIDDWHNLLRVIVMPSSVISYMNYDPEAHRLRVHFLSGAVYDYMDVPEDVYMQIKSAKSKGIFLNKKIKGKYSFNKIN